MDENEAAALLPMLMLTMSEEQLEALIALIEERVVENLTRAIERIVLERDGSGA